MSMIDDYEVGYRKPPKKHRFRKGQSGNPKGRPKKQKTEAAADNTAAAILKRVGERPAVVNGERYSLLELEFLALQSKASKGDIAASRQLSRLRKELGLLVPAKEVQAGGVLVVPGTRSLEEWSAAAYSQQAKYRGKQSADDDGTEGSG
jgi:hypothetical protein